MSLKQQLQHSSSVCQYKDICDFVAADVAKKNNFNIVAVYVTIKTIST